MKKFFKISFLLFINILVFILIIFISDLLIYKYYKSIFYEKHPKSDVIPPFTYIHHLPSYIYDLNGFFNGQNDFLWGRKPDGLEFKNATPIVLFGGSYAYGQYLKYNQTFSYKLAHMLKRPVYNRAIVGGSWHFMYFQTNDNLGKVFYNCVPPSDTVIYIMISDHFRRTLLKYFNVIDDYIYLHYSLKNGNFVLEDYNNSLLRFFNSFYIAKYFNHIYAGNYINNINNSDKLTDMSLKYFTLSREALEKHWGKKVNFIVIVYDDWPIYHDDILIKKLKKNGFIVFKVSDFLKADLNSPEFKMQDNFHPTEKAWDIIVPKLIQSSNLT